VVCYVYLTARTFKSVRRRRVPDFACSPNVDPTTNAITSVTGQSLAVLCGWRGGATYGVGLAIKIPGRGGGVATA